MQQKFEEGNSEKAAKMRRRLSSFLEADASEELTPTRRASLNEKFEAMLGGTKLMQNLFSAAKNAIIHHLGRTRLDEIYH